jgi:hypothetical protein
MFRVVGKIVTLNALETVIIDHKCYFNAIKKMALRCYLLKFSLISNSIALGRKELFIDCDSNMNSCDDPNLRLHTPR